jgi:hypothetical protein
MTEPKYELTATSRIGAAVDPFTGEPTTTVAVHGDEELQKRLDAAKTDPRQLDVTYRRIG